MKKQKFQALLVALCMLVSVIPAMTAPAAQATDPATQVIVLGAPESGPNDIQMSAVDIEVSEWEVNQSKTHPETWSAASTMSNTWHTSSKLLFRWETEYLAIDFKVNESGYYNIDLVIENWSYTPVFSTTIDGAPMNDFAWPGGNTSQVAEVVTRNIGSKYLTAGVHTFVMTCTANPNYVYFKSLNLTPTEAPEVEPGYSKTVNLFDAQNRGSFAVMDINADGWEIDEAATSLSIYAQTMGNGSERPETAIYGDCSKFQFSNGEDVGFAFMVDANGYYDLSTMFKVYNGAWCTAVQIFVDDEAVGSVDAYDIDGDPDGTFTNIPLKKQVYLEAGIHVFKLHQAGGGGDRVIIQSFTLTASEVQEAAEETPFGYRYALVKNSEANGEEKYSLYVISAIRDTNYKNAGFDLVINGDTKTEFTHDVYKSFKFTNSGAGNWVTYVRPADFGLNDGYIYFVEYELSEAEVKAGMNITAFVTNEEDEKILGKTVTVAASN